jgi:hypothetical protein
VPRVGDALLAHCLNSIRLRRACQFHSHHPFAPFHSPRTVRRLSLPTQRSLQTVYLPGSWDFRILSTESIVFQLRVVAGAPKSLSIWPR